MWLKESIKQRRKTLGWSVKEAAKEIGITSQALYYIEKGERIPSLDLLRLISVAYQTPMWVFLYCADDGVSVDNKVQPAYKSMRASINQVLKELL